MVQTRQEKKKRTRWATVGGFLKTVPGLLTAMATMLTAVAGILAALTQLGVIQVRSPIVMGPATTIQQVAPSTSATGSGGATASSDPGASAGAGGELVNVYLADLDATQRSNQASPRDEANINGQSYPHSILFYGCCPATADYDLGRHYRRLKATLGVNDEAPSDARSTFEVFLDGRKVYSTIVKLGKPATLDLDVSDILRLRMIMTGGVGGDYRAVWGDAQLLGAPGEVPTSTP
jgi:hypothetical protein